MLLDFQYASEFSLRGINTNNPSNVRPFRWEHESKMSVYYYYTMMYNKELNQ